MLHRFARSGLLRVAGLCFLLASSPLAVSAPTGEPVEVSAAFGLPVVELWPPHHDYVALDLNVILELTGEGEGSAVVLAITQDEPVESNGDGNTVCDGTGVGTSVALLRPERRGGGNGRVYKVHFTTSGGGGGEVAGGGIAVLTVIVPHDRSGRPVIDDGQLYNSGAGCP